MRRIIAMGWLFCFPSFLFASAPDIESTYSVRVTMRILKPAPLVQNEYQAAKLLRETDTFREIEYTIFPLVKEEEVVGNRNWRRSEPSMATHLQPGITCNWDEPMRKDLIESLKRDGIDIETLDDKTVVQKVSRWLLNRSKYNDRMFDTWYVDFPAGKPTVLQGLEKAFEKGKGNPNWSVQEQFEHELLGRQMYFNKTVGSCTSYAILQATVMKALGIPTRIVMLTPIVDANDEKQLEMVRGLKHHHVRTTVLRGLPPPSFSNHTIDEVYVGKRWVRLNYTQLGQPALDANCFGMTVQTNVVNEWSESGYAKTWGARYGLGERDEVTQTGNPYRAMELSDHFGANAKIENPEVTEPKLATVTKAYWKNESGHHSLMLHVEHEPFDGDYKILKNYLRQAPKSFELRAEGHDAIQAEATIGSSTHVSKGLFDVYVKVEDVEYAKLAAGVEYDVVPPGKQQDGFGWEVKGKVVVQKAQ